MRRPLWFRALIGLWGFWFAAALVEAPGVHACAVHSGTGAKQHAHAGHGGSASSHASAHVATKDAHPSQGHNAASDCTCLGSCCSVAPAAIRGPSIELAALTTIASGSRFVRVETLVGIARPYDRPFANGPPAAI